MNWRDKIFGTLRNFIQDGLPSRPRFVYLDSEQVAAFYGELTGAKGLPSLEIQEIGSSFEAKLVIGMAAGAKLRHQTEISSSYIYASMRPVLHEIYRSLDVIPEGGNITKSFWWLRGTLSNTIMLSVVGTVRTWARMELMTCGHRNLVFLEEQFVSSIYRPLIRDEQSFNEGVEGLFYVHGLTGDNNVKMMLTPVVMETNQEL